MRLALSQARSPARTLAWRQARHRGPFRETCPRTRCPASALAARLVPTGRRPSTRSSSGARSSRSATRAAPATTPTTRASSSWASPRWRVRKCRRACSPRSNGCTSCTWRASSTSSRPTRHCGGCRRCAASSSPRRPARVQPPPPTWPWRLTSRTRSSRPSRRWASATTPRSSAPRSLWWAPAPWACARTGGRTVSTTSASPSRRATLGASTTWATRSSSLRQGRRVGCSPTCRRCSERRPSLTRPCRLRCTACCRRCSGRPPRASARPGLVLAPMQGCWSLSPRGPRALTPGCTQRRSLAPRLRSARRSGPLPSRGWWPRTRQSTPMRPSWPGSGC
ncbi:MAG: Uncharacterised protein [Porticoccaceae bacterium UBA1117]|nr:MAG: Uncharacterised protein [Porticoccaceae bacterium UBA1117]